MDPLITLVCPSCGGKTEFGVGARHFVCEYCGNTHAFNLPSQLVAPADEPRRRARLPRPKAITLEKKDQNLKLVWRWFSPKFYALALFCLFWDGFLIFWYTMAITTQSVIMCLFPMLHLAVGVGLSYYTLAGFLNHSTVSLDRQMLTVQHDPVPWPGEIKLPVQDLEQLYCKEVRNTSNKGRTSYSYELCAALKDGTQKKILSGLESPDIGFFLEQQIEAWLNIPDEEIGGEMPR